MFPMVKRSFKSNWVPLLITNVRSVCVCCSCRLTWKLSGYRKRKRNANLFRTIGYSKKGHLTFILLGKLSSKSKAECFDCVACTRARVSKWTSECSSYLCWVFERVAIIHSSSMCGAHVFRKPRLFSHRNLLSVPSSRLIVPTQISMQTLDHRWFVGSHARINYL